MVGCLPIQHCSSIACCSLEAHCKEESTKRHVWRACRIEYIVKEGGGT